MTLGLMKNRIALVTMTAIIAWWLTPTIDRALPQMDGILVSRSDPISAVGWGWVNWFEGDPSGGYWSTQIALRPPSIRRSFISAETVAVGKTEPKDGLSEVWRSTEPEAVEWVKRYRAAKAIDASKSWSIP